jgi:Porin subfamily
VLGWTQDFINQTSAQLYANRAFIQFAGFTFGKATSCYDIYSAPATS